MAISNTAVFALKLNTCVIVAVDSRATVGEFAKVDTNNYNKLIPVDEDMIYLACSGTTNMTHKLKGILKVSYEKRRLLDLESMNDVANMVVGELNSIISKMRRDDDQQQLAEDDDVMTCDLALVGATAMEDNNYSIHTIKQDDNNPWEFTVIPETTENNNHVMMKGCASYLLPSFLNENPFNPNMSEKEGVMYAFKAIEYSVQNCWGCGGTIRVVAINSDDCNPHVWKQKNPQDCMDPYFYKHGLYFYDFAYNAGIQEPPYHYLPDDSDDKSSLDTDDDDFIY